MWMDHRAKVEADAINATHHEVLKYTGNAISVEMEPPKLMWLKKVMRVVLFTSCKHILVRNTPWGVQEFTFFF